MKKRNLLLVSISILSLSGCTFFDKITNFFKKDQPTNSVVDDTPVREDKTEEKKQIGEFYGGVVNSGKYVGYEFSKSQSDLVQPTSGVGEVNIVAFNDFHGAVLETEREAGLKQLGTYFKAKSKEVNTLILDQGDTWQGSFESNYEYGAIVQDVFNYAGVTLRTLGNHDFDWGLDHLVQTNNRKLQDDYIPALGANVFDYSNGTNGKLQQSKYGKEYATFVLDNGIKVGIVGVIGESQITSICSTFVETVCFTDHIQKIKDISDFLRTDKKCDIIIASTHESSESMYGRGLADVSPKTNKRYTDLVLSGHAHYRQEYSENGVKFVQWDSNGETTGTIKLKYDFSTKQVSDQETVVSTFNKHYLNVYYPEIESTIDQMVDEYLSETEPIASEVLSTNFTGKWSTNNLAYLMSESIYNSLKNTGISVDFAVCNYARDEFSGSEFAYGDLYKCFPFDNTILLMDVSSERSCNSIRHNQTYREDLSKNPTVGNTYRIAVVDYIGLHQNESRRYDYFPDATNVSVYKVDGEPLLYREVLRNYLKANSSTTFDSANYNNSNPHFSF